jgi:NTP pyrophosphatase (non-canonical NTP hydrolase)
MNETPKSELQLPDRPTLADFQIYARKMSEERGFTNDTLEQKFLMLLEEAGELAKAARHKAGLKFAADTSQREVQAEAADVFIVLLHICNLLNVDLEGAFREKEAHNKQRIWQ